jgi:hypothetical protein
VLAADASECGPGVSSDLWWHYLNHPERERTPQSLH